LRRFARLWAALEERAEFFAAGRHCNRNTQIAKFLKFDRQHYWSDL
jgi:hypothetical protein